MDRCELSDLSVDQCGCRVHKPTAGPEWVTIVARFGARFDSRLDCDHEVHAGDSIARTREGHLICGECAS